MTIAEFRNEMVEKVFNQNSETVRGYVSLNDYKGIYFVRLDEDTIAYRINTNGRDYDWKIEPELMMRDHLMILLISLSYQ